jgi:hypothetical protein
VATSNDKNTDTLTQQMQAELAAALEKSDPNTPPMPHKAAIPTLPPGAPAPMTDPPRFEDRHKRAKALSPTVSRNAAPVGETVVLPKHYTRFQIEPIRFIGENKLNFFQGNIVKYILRYDAKNGLEDVRKAKRYCRMFELYLEGYPDWWGPDPAAQELTGKLEAIFKGFREFAREVVVDPEVRSQLLANITILEAQHVGSR